VYLVNQGDLEGSDLARRLNDSGRISRGHIRSHTVAVYACLKPRYSELRIGEPWSDSVTGQDLEVIRSQVLNPGLRSQTPQQAFVDSLGRLGEKVNVCAELQSTARRILLIVVGVGGGILLCWWAAVQYPRAAPFRLLAWIWGQTPAGKAEARRAQQARLKASQSYVRNWEGCIDRDRALIGWIPPDLEEQLRNWDGQRKRLDQLDLEQAGALARETERLFKRVGELSRPWSQCRSSCQQAAEVLEGLRKALRPVKVKGKRKAPAEPCPEFSEFESRLEQCKQEQLTSQELEERTTRQKLLREQISAFWKEKEPASWKARFESSYSSSTDSSTSSYEPSSSPSSSSSSYDYNQDQNWSSGSSESRSGGEW